MDLMLFPVLVCLGLCGPGRYEVAQAYSEQSGLTSLGRDTYERMVQPEIRDFVDNAFVIGRLATTGQLSYKWSF